jgi:glycosyltransferase involved in cell wall biosynthesis
MSEPYPFKMKKLLHYISLDGVGGVEILFHELLKHFPDSTIQHYLALYTDSVHGLFRETVAQRIREKKSIKYLGKFKLPKMPHFLRSWNNQRILNTSGAEVVLFWNSIDHDDYLRPQDYRRNSRFVFYDQGTSWYKEENYKNSELFLSNTALSLCCSHASKRILELYHQHNGAKTVIHNPLRPGFNNQGTDAKFIPSPSDRPIRLGIAGRFVHIKGISIAIHAVEILSRRGVDVELFIAGTGRYESSYKKLAQQLNIEKQVIFLGLVEDMASFYSGIDIFVCPSIREPFGIVAVEAMGTGCPLICARIDGLAEVVTQGKTGIGISPSLPITEYEKMGGGLNGLPEFVYYPDLDGIDHPKAIDPAAIADAVAQITADPDVYRDMSLAGIRDARLRFSFEHYLKQFCAALNSVCEA